jgi:PEP-CTERM motif
MRHIQRLSCVVGAAILGAGWLATVNRADAQFTLTGTSAELVARGINADFEAPAVARGDGESTTTANLGPGWTFNLLGGISSNHGVQDPSVAFFSNGTAGATPPAPFDGLQIGFINLDAFSHAEIVSEPIGRLRASSIYTLNVAVGARNTATWPDIQYRVGLRDGDGNDLGTFGTVMLNPGLSPTVVQDLTYTLNTSSLPSAVGKEVSVVVGGYNPAVIDGLTTVAFTQPNFDNVRLAGTFDDLTGPSALLTVNRANGNLSLSNSSGSDFNIKGYTLTSEAGGFDVADWTEISGSVPSWDVLGGSGTTGDLSEAEVTSGAGLVLSTATARNLGNAWLQTPHQDVQGTLLLADGSTIDLEVAYSGAAIPEGDLSGNGVIDVADWTAFKSGQGTNFDGLSLAEAYLKGDLDGDMDHDLADFGRFRTAFNTANGAGSFQSITGVPEPGTMTLLAVAGMLGSVIGLRQRRLQWAPGFVRRRALVWFVAVGALAIANVASAAVTVDRLYRFGENGTLPQNQENGSDDAPVGSGPGNPLPGATLDHVGPSGSFQGLSALANAGGVVPVYENVSSTGSLAQPRPGSTAGALGVLFDGTDDYLSGLSLGYPPITRSTINGGGTGTLNYNGLGARGFQVWVYPHAGATDDQHVVMDTTEHGLRINDDGTGEWAMVFGGTEVDSNVDVTFNEWHHLMVAMPEISAPARGVMYLNGVAIAGRQENYSTDPDINASALAVGANTNVINADGSVGTPAAPGIENFFRGVLDELELFVWGQGYDPATDTFTDFGTFDFHTDNDFAATNLSAVFGDIDDSGSVGQGDIDALVAGWRNEKTVNGIRAGDITTYAEGDLNFDGITDLVDVQTMIEVVSGSGGSAGLDISALVSLAAVPEPGSMVLAALGALAMGMVARRRCHA